MASLLAAIVTCFLILAVSAQAQEQLCTELGSVCACSEPMDVDEGPITALSDYCASCSTSGWTTNGPDDLKGFSDTNTNISTYLGSNNDTTFEEIWGGDL